MFYYRIVILFVYDFNIISCDLILTPRNTVTSVGDKAAFHCQSNIANKSIFWSKILSDDDEYSIYKYSLLAGRNRRYNVSVSSGEYEFVIKSMTSSDAGTYFVTDNNGFGKSFEFDLNVLNTRPSCQKRNYLDETTNTEIVNISCNVVYSGRQRSFFSWYDQTRKSVNSSEEVSSKSVNGVVLFSVNSHVKIKSTKNNTYCVVMHFVTPTIPNPNTADSNSPDYQFVWSSSGVNEDCKTIASPSVNKKTSLYASSNSSQIHTSPLPSAGFTQTPDDVLQEKVATQEQQKDTSGFGDVTFLICVVIGSGVGVILLALLVFICRILMKNKTQVNNLSQITIESLETNAAREYDESDTEYAEIDDLQIKNNTAISPACGIYETAAVRETPRIPVYIQLLRGTQQ